MKQALFNSDAPSERTWQQLRREVESQLATAGLASAATEARWIVETASGRRGADLLAAQDQPATEAVATRVARMVERRVAGEPLQYVLGEWEFRGIDLFVDQRVLIPRPETEVTAQVAIDIARRLGARRGHANPWTGANGEYTVVDLGTGSGAIALALAAELPDAEFWATDASEDALAVARANLAGAGAGATRMRLAHGEWFAALPDRLRGNVRVVVTNPPYVAEAELDQLPREVVDHEPRLALVSGPTGLEAIACIVTAAPQWLEPGGALVVELAPHQSDEARGLARDAGLVDVVVERDLTDRDRVLVAHVQ
ncbi:MAG: peptide chain release factor N(5)-glutamine methyltransferase [Acidimicrobiia bacterium]